MLIFNPTPTPGGVIFTHVDCLKHLNHSKERQDILEPVITLIHLMSFPWVIGGTNAS